MPSESMRELTFLRSDPSWGQPMVLSHRKRLVGVKIAHRFLKAKVLLHRQHAINVEFKFEHLRGSPAAADMQGALGGCQHR